MWKYFKLKIKFCLADFAKEFKGRRQSPKKISDKTAFPYNPRADLKINPTAT